MVGGVIDLGLHGFLGGDFFGLPDVNFNNDSKIQQQPTTLCVYRHVIDQTIHP
jgi:hypothetical protein